MATQPGFKNPLPRRVQEKHTTSAIDTDAGYIHHGSKRGVGYLLETTVDCKHGIVTGVDVYPANEKESACASAFGKAFVRKGMLWFTIVSIVISLSGNISAAIRLFTGAISG